MSLNSNLSVILLYLTLYLVMHSTANPNSTCKHFINHLLLHFISLSTLHDLELVTTIYVQCHQSSDHVDFNSFLPILTFRSSPFHFVLSSPFTFCLAPLCTVLHTLSVKFLIILQTKCLEVSSDRTFPQQNQFLTLCTASRFVHTSPTHHSLYYLPH